VKLSAPAPVLTPELVAFVHSGVAIGVATRDQSLRPALARAWGAQVATDRRSLTLSVAAPEGSATRANLEQNGAIAVSFSPPTIAKAVQFKGVAEILGEPGPDEREHAEHHNSAFLAECDRIGAPRELAERMFVGAGLLLVNVSIQDGFDQTPGPTAGRRL
jgi:flavin reductase (DIM6/NTAB) family NADH-FMN oxidoreductase RutF